MIAMTRMTAAMIPRAAGAKPAGPAQYTYICIQRTARDASLICVYARRVHVVESTAATKPEHIGNSHHEPARRC